MFRGMGKRQKLFVILFYVIGFTYLILTNHFALKVPKTLESEPGLFVSSYVFCLLVLIIHSVVFGSWMGSFVPNFLTGDDKEQPNEEKFIRNKSKLFIRFRNWINDETEDDR